MRLIDADKVPYVEAVKDTLEPSGEFYARREDIRAMPTIKPEQQWIPCSEVTGEGYPNENGMYYVTEQNYGFYLDAAMKQKITHVSCFVDGEFLDRFFDKNASNIVAWCPLPKPYEERLEE